MEYDDEIMNNRRCYTCKYTYVAKGMQPCALCYNHKQKPMWDSAESQFKNKRLEILTKASNIVNGRREEEYGSPENNFYTIAKLWSTYIEASSGEPFCMDASDVAVMMALLKIARIAGDASKLDNWVDLAGYAACGGECARAAKE